MVNIKCWWVLRAGGILTDYWWRRKVVQQFWKSLLVSYKVKYSFIIWSNNSTFVLNSMQLILTSYIQSKTWVPTFTAFVHNCQKLEAGDKWIDKLWCIYMMEYYSVIKRNELSNYKKTRVNFKCILLSESSQFEKATRCTTQTVSHSVKGKI